MSLLYPLQPHMLLLLKSTIGSKAGKDFVVFLQTRRFTNLSEMRGVDLTVRGWQLATNVKPHPPTKFEESVRRAMAYVWLMQGSYISRYVA